VAVVVYDSACGFCRWCLALLLSADRRRRLRPLALGTAAADRLLADLDQAERAASWHLLDGRGERASAGAALAPALELLPGGAAPAAILRRVPRLAERGYGLVAGNRARLGRLLPARARRWADGVIAAASGRGGAG
jgi:predicted DCC family thiol-disulfide oxidoreductase YuxK